MLPNRRLTFTPPNQAVIDLLPSNDVGLPTMKYRKLTLVVKYFIVRYEVTELIVAELFQCQ